MMWFYFYMLEVLFFFFYFFEGMDFMVLGIILFLMVNMIMWIYMGYNMFIFFLVLQVVLCDLYEVVCLDGVFGFQIVMCIKVLFVCGVVLFVVLLFIIGMIQLFNELVVLQVVNLWMGKDFMFMMFIYNMMMGEFLFFGSGLVFVYFLFMVLIVGVFVIVYVLLQCWKGDV